MEGTGVYRINGNLAVARAIGDIDERPFVSGMWGFFFCWFPCVLCCPSCTGVPCFVLVVFVVSALVIVTIFIIHSGFSNIPNT